MNHKTTLPGSPSYGSLQNWASLTLLHQRLILSDDEVNEICKGVKSNAAKIRALQRMNIKVYRKPDGSPLVFRVDLLERFILPNASPLGFNTVPCEPKWMKPI